MYGIIMGFLVMYENWLLISVLIHAINSYFIFTVKINILIINVKFNI